MSYTAIILPEGEKEIKVLFNSEPKPEYTTSRDYPSALEYWQSKSKLIDFYSMEERDKVMNHIKGSLSLEKAMETVKEATRLIGKGLEVDCIEIKDIPCICEDFQTLYQKQAFFKSAPKEETVSEERLYTKQDMLNFLDHVAGIYKPISQSGEIIYWTKSYNDKKANRYSTNDLLTEFDKL